MRFSALINTILTKPTAMRLQAEDGYFGWTDRYGLHRSGANDADRSRSHSFFNANH